SRSIRRRASPAGLSTRAGIRRAADLLVRHRTVLDRLGGRAFTDGHLLPRSAAALQRPVVSQRASLAAAARGAAHAARLSIWRDRVSVHRDPVAHLDNVGLFSLLVDPTR